MLRYWLKTGRIYSFCQAKSSVKYPYLFGGLQANDFPVPQGEIQITKQVFGTEITTNFCEAYKAYLEGLKNKDRQFLSSVASKELVKNIEFVDVQLVNQNDPIQAKIGIERIILGVGFDRSTHNTPWSVVGKEQDNKLFQIYRASLGYKIPLLFSVEVYFKSRAKLISSSTNPSENAEKEQIHMVQFEYQNPEYNVISIYGIMMKQLWKSLFSKDKEVMLPVFRSIFKVGFYDWRIADVDKVLGGNFPQLKPQADTPVDPKK